MPIITQDLTPYCQYMKNDCIIGQSLRYRKQRNKLHIDYQNTLNIISIKCYYTYEHTTIPKHFQLLLESE